MVAATGTLQTYTVKGNREDLQDYIYNIDPTDTPMIMLIGEDNATSIKHEWSTDSLIATDSGNAQIEGDDYAAATQTPPPRLENYCQISAKAVSVSRTQRKMNHAAIDDMLDYQIVRNGKSLKRDAETIICGNQGYNVGAATVARKLRSWESWVTSNINANNVTTTAQGATAGATTAGANAAGATVGRTDASTSRDVTEAMLKDVLQKVYSSGGDVSHIMTGPVNKQNLSAFSGRSSARQNIEEDKIQGAAHLYASDFGDLTIIPNRFNRERSILVVDPEYASVAYFDRMHEEDLSKTGDSDRKFLIMEYTLCMKNEAAHGAIFDLTTS